MSRFDRIETQEDDKFASAPIEKYDHHFVAGDKIIQSFLQEFNKLMVKFNPEMEGKQVYWVLFHLYYKALSKNEIHKLETLMNRAFTVSKRVVENSKNIKKEKL